jgi:hypothetical protein
MYCTIDLYEKAAQSTSGQEKPKGRKYDISAEKDIFSAGTPSLRITALAFGLYALSI